jgi:toxin HigB-1
MDIEFQNEDLDRLETDADFSAGYDRAIVKAYRKRMQAMRSARDERDLYAVKGNHFEKLKGGRSHQHSLRLNEKWRLIVEIKPGSPKNTLIVVTIENYH